MDNEELEELGSNYDFVSDEGGDDPILFNPDDLNPGSDAVDPIDSILDPGGETPDQDLSPDEALIGQGYTQDELGNYYKVGPEGQYSFVGSDGKTYSFDAARGGFFDSAGKAAADAVSKSLGNSVKKMIYKKDKDGNLTDELDFAKLLTLGGGAIAASKSNNRTQPAGYQGKIPTYTATRQAPGPDGKLSGNVTFAPKGIAAAAVEGVTPPAIVAPVNTGGIAEIKKGDPSPYANDPEYLRLVNARNVARGGGDIITMDYKPEDRALDEYINSKNPTYRADKEASMGQAANQAGIVAALPTQGAAEPVLAKGGALESGGFVIPADVVSHLGNGSSEAGLRLLAQRYGAAPIKGKGDGMSDSIKTTIDGRQPARVANEEARLTKSQVRAAGGAQKLYAMMDKIRQARTGSKEQGKQINPGKYMPGGAVGYSAGGVPSYEAGGKTTLPTGTTGTESNLSNWAGDYVTNMLGKGQALSEMPYDQYGGKLTADASTLQKKVSTGLGGVAFPSSLGTSFSSSTAPTIGADGMPTGGGGIASNYMNPYLSAVLNPQLAEMRRQAEINNQSSLGGLTKSGAFGGGRQAIMESEAGRNLLTEQNKTIGQGYSNAFDKAMQQFNIEQGQSKDLVGLMGAQGAVDRGIESEKVAADKAQFEEARLNPYKMVQFQQSLLSGLPLAAQTYNQAPTDNLTQFAEGATAIDKALAILEGRQAAVKK
jgi:hypothetical protein